MARESRSRQPLPSDRQGFDRRWFADQLEAVYVPTRHEQVPADLSEAVARFGSAVKVVSGRHCYENFVYNASTRAILDLSALNQAGFDQERGLYFIDAGCENWTAYRSLLNVHGKTLPAGSCYSVGAGGHISGGGYGLLSRRHGLTVDHLHAIDIVTWEASTGRAQLQHVSAASSDADERDLFWALRGAGGGNFGVITRYHFAALPEAPAHATQRTLAWNWDDLTPSRFRDLLDAYGELMAWLPEQAFTLLKLNHRSQGQIGLILQVVSEPGVERHEHGNQVVALLTDVEQRLASAASCSPLRQPLGGHLGRMQTMPSSDQAQQFTYLEALQTLNGSGPNQCGKYKSAYMNQPFPPEQIEAIHHWLQVVPDGVPEAEMAQSLLQVDSYGGAINRIASEATAVPQRQSIMKLQYQTYWNNDAPAGESDKPRYRSQEQAHLLWIQGFYADVYARYGGTPDPARDPDGVVAGCYYNYPDVDLGSHADGRIDQALWLYFLENYRQRQRNLVAIKQRWDPENRFHHAQSVPVQ